MQKMILLGLLFTFCMAAGAEEKVYKSQAVVVVKKEYIAAFKLAVQKILEPTRDEKGNISYECFQVLNSDGTGSTRFEFREIWETESDLVDIHLNSPHMKAFFKEVGAYFEKDPFISGEKSILL